MKIAYFILVGYFIVISSALTTTKKTTKASVKTTKKLTTTKATTTKPRNPCESYPCQHNGTCRQKNSEEFTCTCNPLISSGTYCEKLNPCWTYPCKRGGTCVFKGANFTCLCNKNTYGDKCQYYKDSSTGSTILSTKSLRDLTNLIGISANKTMKLLYQASRDGFNSSIFHSKVDGVSGTLTVIQTPNLNIFGGYTEADWKGNYWWKIQYKYDSNAFLFSLVNSYNKPVKMMVKNPNSAIFSYYDFYGPSFGSGFDLYTSLNYNNNMGNGYSNLGSSYELPSFLNYSEAQSFLAGSFIFSFDELEVYSIFIDACMSSPCKNGGICSLIKSNNFTCKCLNDFQGPTCELTKLNSTIFKNSTILTQENSVKLLNTIKFPLNINWSLIYQASIHGFDANSFHRNCDGVNNVLVIIKSNYSNVFGGYSSVGWKNDIYGSYSYDSNAFIFSLINKYNKSVRLNVTRPDYAIYSKNDYGPTFGEGNDIYISNNPNTYYYSLSYSYLGYSYEKTSFMSSAESSSFLAGGFNFLASEIEVYAFSPCESSPCLNNGKCSLDDQFNYTCSCVNSTGKYCEYKTLDSSLFKGSNIMKKNEDSVTLVNLIKFPTNQSWTLLYQASIHGFDPYVFHSKCRIARNILIIVKPKNSTYIFGGFTSVGWGTNRFYIYDSNAFLFSLTNKYNKSVVMNVKQPRDAVFGSNNYGPSFGAFYYDLNIPMNMNNTNNGYSNIGYTYELPSFIDSSESQTFLAGSSPFEIYDLEAYAFNQCWLRNGSICLNGGKCVDNSYNYTCICSKGYTGFQCQAKILNSTKFINSTILTEELSLSLVNLTGFTNKKFTLLYQGTRDSFSVSSFHSKCDNYASTLTVLKSTLGNVFGGYTTADWSGNWTYKYDTNAFLFSLTNAFNKPQKLTITKPYFAIFTYPNYGPTFGSGHDMHITNNSDTNINSFTYFSSYEKPNVSDFNTFLAGSYQFILDDIEVYLVEDLL